MNFKKTITYFLGICLCFVISSTANAAPTYLTGEEISDSELIEIFKPDDNSILSSDSTCLLSGKVLNNDKNETLTITIYRYNEQNEEYIPIEVNDQELNWTIDTKFFIKEMTLEDTTINKIIIYVERGKEHQLIHKEISVKSDEFKNFINNNGIALMDNLIKALSI